MTVPRNPGITYSTLTISITGKNTAPYVTCSTLTIAIATRTITRYHLHHPHHPYHQRHNQPLHHQQQ